VAGLRNSWTRDKRREVLSNVLEVPFEEGDAMKEDVEICAKKTDVATLPTTSRK